MFAELVGQPGVAEHLALRSRIGFLALHGGLEPGTAELARAAADRGGASLYSVVQPDGLNWHVPAHEVVPLDVPALAGFLAHVDVVVSLHGYRRADLPTALLVGGANRVLAVELGARLRAALPEYEVVDDLATIPPDLRGVHPGNPVNLTRGGGVQLELPHPVRSIGPYRDERYRRHTTVLVRTLAAYAAAAA